MMNIKHQKQRKMEKMDFDEEFDFNLELESDPDEPTTNLLAKLDYEEELKVADRVINDSAIQGYAMFHHELQNEESQDYIQQKDKLISCLTILFGGDKDNSSYKDMATQLVSKLRSSTDEWEGKHQAVLQAEAEKQSTIDESNINSQLVSMISEAILKKQDFFDMFKDADRTQIIHGSMLANLKVNPDDATSIFKRLAGKSQKQMLKAESLLDTDLLQDKLMKRSSLKQAIAQMASEKATQIAQTEKEKNEKARLELAKAKFIQLCQKNLVVALPLLLRIKEKTFVLEGYQLNNGLCYAIAMAFEEFNDIATQFILHGNRLTDVDFSILLNGMSKLTYVRSISYSENDFGPLALDAMKPILMQKYINHSLRELHIKNCKVSVTTTHDLLSILNSNKNFIRSLSLVNANLSSRNCDELCQLIQRSRQLIKLDISWNGLKRRDTRSLIEVISENKTLQWLNLSFNELEDKMQAKFADCNPMIARIRMRE